jgi:hypothetical protein
MPGTGQKFAFTYTGKGATFTTAKLGRGRLSEDAAVTPTTRAVTSTAQPVKERFFTKAQPSHTHKRERQAASTVKLSEWGNSFARSWG